MTEQKNLGPAAVEGGLERILLYLRTFCIFMKIVLKIGVLTSAFGICSLPIVM